MSISSVSSVSASNSSAKAQLQRDQKKLGADIKAGASAAQLKADRAAIVKDQQGAATVTASATKPTAQARSTPACRLDVTA
jgi:hypothetical protein